MKKYFYITVTVEENGKYYPYVIKVSENDNLQSKLNVKGLIHANIFPTKKKAYEICEFWRSCYKTNGTYLF